jgi:single-stranded-DNA-specific exonuclease
MTSKVQWVVRETDMKATASLASALDIPPLAARLLVNRGITDRATAQSFLDPCLDNLLDPFLLPDVEKAVDRLIVALDSGETIFLHADYDTDGVTSAALCFRALSALGANIIGHVPRRSDGYDLQKVGVDRAKAHGATLILTADCGSCAIEPIAYANSFGMEVIVTDHHRPGPILPEAVAIVNPYREDCIPPPFQSLCGAGVAYKVLDALISRRMPQHREAFRRRFTDLVALGTVADVTPLIGENRILVAEGLRILATAERAGIRALLTSLDLLDKPLTAHSISFRLGPRLNSAGRVEDAMLAYRLLATRDRDEAESLAVQLGAMHDAIREETARATVEAVEEALRDENKDLRVLVLAREKWGKGVLGIVATRIAETFRRPVILLSLNEGKYGGSARSYNNFNLHQALHECADLLETFGGHSVAAGVSLRPENLDAFRAKMHLLAEGFDPPPAVLEADAEVTSAAELDFALLDTFKRMEPFGAGNPEPLFLTRGAMVLGTRRVGKEGSVCQMRLRLPGRTPEIKAVNFQNGEWADTYGIGDNIDILYRPFINVYKGNENIELQLQDVRPSI